MGLILGEPGSGKSRLIAEMRPSRTDAIHLGARISSLRSRPPLDQWAEALQGSLAADGTTLAPALGDRPDESLIERVVRLLGRVSSRRPVTLILDDIHWADGSVWELLLRLAQDHSDGRLFVLASARARELPCRAAVEALRILDEDSRVHRVELSPLSPGDLGELVAAASTRDGAVPRVIDWLTARSQGNPRLATGLLAGLLADGAHPGLSRPPTIPRSLVRWVLAEVARLDPAESKVLDLLALVGGSVDPGDLAGMVEGSASDLAIAIEGLIRSGLVDEREHGRSLAYEIHHPLVADTLYGQMCGARRRVLHRHVAGILMASGRADSAAWHLVRSARVGDVQAIDALFGQLRDADRQGSHATVWAIAPALTDLLPAGDERWLEMSDAVSRPSAASLLYDAERYTASQMGAMLKIEEQLAGVGDLKRQASIRLRRAGFLAYGAGEKDSGQLECRHALVLSRQAGREHESRMAAIELAKMRGWFGDIEGQERAGRQLLAEAEEFGDQCAIVVALGVVGVALGLQGRFDEAERLLARCVDLCSSTQSGFSRSQAIGVLMVLAVLQGHGAVARARWSPVSGAGPQAEGHSWSSEVFVALLTGDLPTVRERGRQANALDPEAQLSEPPWLVLLTAMAEAEGGRLSEARWGLTLAARDRRADDGDIFSQFRRWGEGLACWAEDRLGAATGALDAAVRGLSAMRTPAMEAYLLADLVEVAVAAGEDEIAESAASRAEEIARQLRTPSYQALHHFASAWVLLAADRGEAATAAALAVEGFGTCGLRLLQSRARVVYARALRASERKKAIDALHEAAATFDAAGAVVRRERARTQLAQLVSHGGRGAARLGGHALTGREAEVAELAARGFTARHIADGLHIGVRTVETHLARIYSKLGVASKQQLISRGAELGLVPASHHRNGLLPR